ncbi:MAG: hypothetical protein M0R80_18320 [Proteobacteria bacterium]|jgi:hypothetical protein|nr:hypothetical protein [Pseudomonadota bacterium]
MSNFLNLDDLSFKEFEFEGNKIRFKVPKMTELKKISKMEKEIKGIKDDDLDKILEVVAKTVCGMIPEIPKEIFANFTPGQLRSFLQFVTDQDENLDKKKLLNPSQG